MSLRAGGAQPPPRAPPAPTPMGTASTTACRSGDETGQTGQTVQKAEVPVGYTTSTIWSFTIIEVRNTTINIRSRQYLYKKSFMNKKTFIRHGDCSLNNDSRIDAL